MILIQTKLSGVCPLVSDCSICSRANPKIKAKSQSILPLSCSYRLLPTHSPQPHTSVEQREIWCQLAIILVPYSAHSKICCCYCESYQPSSALFRFASQPSLSGAQSHANRGGIRVVIQHLWRSPDVGKHATFCLPLNTRALEDQKERTKRRKGRRQQRQRT